jgi:predicted PurR-regulated permease PerM
MNVLGLQLQSDQGEAAASPSPSMLYYVPNLILSILALIAGLYLARDVLIPVLLAFLVAVLLRPIMRRMRPLHIPDYMSAFLLVAVVAIVFLLGALKLVGQAQEWLTQGPESLRKVSKMIPTETGPLMDMAKMQEAIDELTSVDSASKPVQVEVKSQATAMTAIGVSGHLLGSAMIVVVVSFFLLTFSDTLLKQAVESRDVFQEKRNIVQIVQNVENGLAAYLGTITAINAGLGVATAGMMWVLGIPNPVLWGVMATTLNYVPHVGAFVCMAVLFVVGAVTHESLASGAIAAGMFALLTAIESYFITPLVLSRSLQLSPLAVIMSILFWGWLWGIPGGLLAAPLLAVMKIVSDQFATTQDLSKLLAGTSAGPLRDATNPGRAPVPTPTPG